MAAVAVTEKASGEAGGDVIEDEAALGAAWGQFRAARQALRTARAETGDLIATLRAQGVAIGAFLLAQRDQAAQAGGQAADQAESFDAWLRRVGIAPATALRLMAGEPALQLRGTRLRLALSDAQAHSARAALARLADPALRAFNLVDDWIRALFLRCQSHLRALFEHRFDGHDDRCDGCLPDLSLLPAIRIAAVGG